MEFLDRLIAAQQANGFRDFAGTQVSGRIPLRQGLINEAAASALRGKGGAIKGVTVLITAENRLIAGIDHGIFLVPKPLRVEVTFPQQVDLRRDPVLRLGLGGLGGRLAGLAGVFFAGKFPEGVSIGGDHIAIDVRRLLTSRNLGQYYPLLQTLGFQTDAGILLVNFEVGVPTANESNK